MPSLREQSQRLHSNALRAAFDDTRSRRRDRERYVEGHYGLGEAFEGERANLLGYDISR